MHPPLRFANYLAPNMLPAYAAVVRAVGRALGVPTTLGVGEDYDGLGDFDAAFVCGLAYVELRRLGRIDVTPVAAPLLEGVRYGGRPVYFSDVIVRADSPFHRFADLRGRSWAYNEPLSQSGHGVTLYRLACLGESCGFFGRVVEAGFHERAIRLVAGGAVDASAIDCQVLAVALREQPELAGHLRVIDSLGPSTVQPLVVSNRLPPQTRDAIRGAVLGVHEDPDLRRQLSHGFIDQFVAVRDEDYDDLRAMRAACVRAGCVALR